MFIGTGGQLSQAEERNVLDAAPTELRELLRKVSINITRLRRSGSREFASKINKVRPTISVHSFLSTVS
jgi:hypothetical protein